MKRLALTVAALTLAAGAALADPAEGVWQTQPDDGAYAHVTIAPCGQRLCGTISRTFKGSSEYNSPNKGKQLVMGMTPQGNGKYTGKVWRPSNGKIYNGKMQVSGKTLKMSGCIAGGLLCSSQVWTRLK
ncbi:MAG: DUF2147 domain-containing protein [Marinovum algicola]|mgnify:FL=1|jgi:uncharacterized protein (DUF2147 family)|uniref:Uncharacterized conserved protein, DUF2147 family n=1 Tax=Marinovum algicola TaxID=42444 RepID=A0A975ZPG3_9RHOB|nr:MULTISPECIES: DUF2147 domain-containing protein [Marinovum]AKO95355.1 Glycerol-3-phosphate ABC transporter [Marinovum algicola DG 898]MDD9742307.1 DUF2147 domain-containing protein [Marinovum sp. SP66]MDD9746481.1 DUF2147 domain-containing protein [Marinovum sp. PR37]SEJ86676.1 Uncharacterized conserved protein, DUF2147 family [Marinovum algicola]SLN67265.1 hypothetical protein MAA5396_03623 [Marinovum algicola]